jgi:internalin A
LDGLAIARQRIATEASQKTGFLNLGGLALTELPEELFALKHLHRLNLGPIYLGEDGQLQLSPVLYEKPNLLVDWIDELAKLPKLRHLSLSGMELSGLGSLRGLSKLESLVCVGAQLRDLGPFHDLSNLQWLDCSQTQVSDLSPLRGLSNLQRFDCSQTQVDDLSPLRGLLNLRSLNCWSTGVSDLEPLQLLSNLQSLDCPATQVKDLSPLHGLINFQSLNCGSTGVTDLGPLKNLTNLHTLNCRSTGVRDLRPLRQLYNLQILICSNTQVSDLSPLQGLVNLNALAFQDAPVSDLVALRNLLHLQKLVCSGTQVCDLAPLKHLTNLEVLDVSGTRVENLSGIESLAKLQSLNCSVTEVRDLTPLKDSSNLRTLACGNSRVHDLTPLDGLSNLQTLNCSWCKITTVSDNFWFKTSLKEIFLFKANILGIPCEILSENAFDNCLYSLRSQLTDLSAGRIKVRDIKLMVLGNGHIGKTQICRRLRGEDYDASVESTHGILVNSAPLPGSEPDRERFQIWDFGGQDIYHGTHALFMRSRAIFLVVWIPKAETTPEHSDGGFVFRNQPLAYWLDYVRHFGGTDSPVLVVQTQCDRPEDEILALPIPNSTLSNFPFKKVLHYSARENRGRGALDEALHQAAAWLHERDGVAEIGAGRWQVKQRLDAMRDEDAARPPVERKWRTITQNHFRDLCKDAGGVSWPAHLLSYLHNAGIVFYRAGLFGNQIIIDQGWILESVYAVLHREKCIRKLQQRRGRFTRSDLADWLWDAAGHSVAEQELFLSMMQSCGICFVHRPPLPDKNIEAEYIAPDFLPERSEIAQDLALKWDIDLPTESVKFDYSFLHPGLMRAVISKIGSAAGLNADYWHGGVFAYEGGTGSRALIEEEKLEGWQGRIRVSIQRGQAALLLERLTALIEEEQHRMGMNAVAVTMTGGSAVDAPKHVYREAIAERASEYPPPLKFAQEPAAQCEYFVSYAWKDDTEEGKQREVIVDQLCAAAQQHGITILRDKDVIGLGDQISKFMKRIGRGNRVFVVLSDKYLKSPYCMYELCELWQHCRQDDKEFLDHVRVYTLPDAKIWTPFDRANYAEFWEKECSELKAKVHHLSVPDFHRYRCMKAFSHYIGEILTTMTDILQPQNFEQLEQYGFSDGSSPGACRR